MLTLKADPAIVGELVEYQIIGEKCEVDTKAASARDGLDFFVNVLLLLMLS